MIRRNTWILLVLLVALVAFAVYFQRHKAQQAASVTPTAAVGASKPLFSAEDGQPTDIKVEDTTGQSVEIQRNQDGQWVLKAPTNTQADQAAAEAAATQVTSLQVLSSLQLGLDIVGLDKPSYTMTFTFDGGKTHTLQVGAQTPIEDGYYCSLDKGPVQVIDKAGIEALTGLLANPPYAVTPTPEASATPEVPTTTETAPAPSAAPGTGTPEGTVVPAITDTPVAATPTP